MAYYNQLSVMNDVPKQIVRNIITFVEDADGVSSNNDNLFKLLKYNSTDALSNSITTKDKIAVLNQNTDLAENGVIFQRFNDFTFEEKITQLRIFIQSGNPINNTLSNIIVGFDIVVHNDLNILDNGDNRSLIILNELLKTLNGMEIGLGILDFSIGGGFVLLDFNESFQGYRLTMGTRSN